MNDLNTPMILRNLAKIFWRDLSLVNNFAKISTFFIKNKMIINYYFRINLTYYF